MKKRILLTLFLGMLSISTLEARAWSGDWSTWDYLSNQVSVSYNQVQRDTWTWKFRNEGVTTIKYMSFKYWDKDGEHRDVLPGSLRPGEVFGGWAAFTASSRPTIVITEIERK
jgi:hypothetical protein